MVTHIFTRLSLAGNFVFISAEFGALYLFCVCEGVPYCCGIVHVAAQSAALFVAITCFKPYNLQQLPRNKTATKISILRKQSVNITELSD
jgi:hypothetical protein